VEQYKIFNLPALCPGSFTFINFVLTYLLYIYIYISPSKVRLIQLLAYLSKSNKYDKFDNWYICSVKHYVIGNSVSFINEYIYIDKSVHKVAMLNTIGD
jgi:hypothetical protein